MPKVTEREAARKLARSRGALQEARKRGDLVRAVSRDARGRLVYDVEIAREELEEAAALRVDAKGEAGETLQRWRAARARLAEAQAAQSEDELRVKRGALVDAKAIEAGDFTTIAANARQVVANVAAARGHA